jgi:hypothetical protein
MYQWRAVVHKERKLRVLNGGKFLVYLNDCYVHKKAFLVWVI